MTFFELETDHGKVIQKLARHFPTVPTVPADRDQSCMTTALETQNKLFSIYTRDA